MNAKIDQNTVSGHDVFDQFAHSAWRVDEIHQEWFPEGEDGPAMTETRFLLSIAQAIVVDRDEYRNGYEVTSVEVKIAGDAAYGSFFGHPLTAKGERDKRSTGGHVPFSKWRAATDGIVFALARGPVGTTIPEHYAAIATAACDA